MCSVCTFIVVKQSWLSQFPNSGCHQGIATFEPIPECKAQRNIGTSMPHLALQMIIQVFKSSSSGISVKSPGCGRKYTKWQAINQFHGLVVGDLCHPSYFKSSDFLPSSFSSTHFESMFNLENPGPATGRTRQSQGNHPSASENSM